MVVFVSAIRSVAHGIEAGSPRPLNPKREARQAYVGVSNPTFCSPCPGKQHGGSLNPWIVTSVLVVIGMLLVRRVANRFTPALALLPFVAWSLQEATERIGGGEALPFATSSIKHIAVGLLLQVPVALIVYLLVRVAVAVVHRLVRAFARPRLRASDAAKPTRERKGFSPRVSVLVRGSPTRGPPSSSTSRSHQAALPLIGPRPLDEEKFIDCCVQECARSACRATDRVGGAVRQRCHP